MNRIKSFIYAFKGIALLIRTQPNARIHLFATCVVVAAGFYLSILPSEWLAIVLCLVLVWMAEAFNSALEFLGDAVTKEQHPLIGNAKDLGAAAVLITAIGSVIVGGIVFVPYLLKLF